MAFLDRERGFMSSQRRRPSTPVDDNTWGKSRCALLKVNWIETGKGARGNRDVFRDLLPSQYVENLLGHDDSEDDADSARDSGAGCTAWLAVVEYRKGYQNLD